MPKATGHLIPVSPSPFHNHSAGQIADELGALKAEMGEEWYTAHCRPGTSTTLRVTARKGLAQAA